MRVENPRLIPFSSSTSSQPDTIKFINSLQVQSCNMQSIHFETISLEDGGGDSESGLNLSLLALGYLETFSLFSFSVSLILGQLWFWVQETAKIHASTVDIVRVWVGLPFRVCPHKSTIPRISGTLAESRVKVS